MSGAFVFLHPRNAHQHKEHEMNEHTAKQVLHAIEDAEKSTPGLLSRLDNLTGRITKQGNLNSLLIGALTIGLSVTVREVSKQRRTIDRLTEHTEALAEFTKTLVDHTDCGEEAFLYLQIQAEENEPPEWTDEDDEPIPYTTTDKPVSEDA